MTDLTERLRIYAGQNYDSSVSFDAPELCRDAADEIERLQSSLARHVDSVCALTAERDALRARIEEAQILEGGDDAGSFIRWTSAMQKFDGKRVALVVIE